MLQADRRHTRALALWGPRARAPPAQENIVDSGVRMESHDCRRRFAPMGDRNPPERVIAFLRNQ